jgi:hypothetical protein
MMLWLLVAVVAVAGSVAVRRRRAPDRTERLAALVSNLVTALGPGFANRSSFHTLQRRVLADALRLRTISVNGVVRVPGALDVALAAEDRETIASAAATFVSDIGAALDDRVQRAGWQLEGRVDLQLLTDDDVEPGRPRVARRSAPSGGAGERVAPARPTAAVAPRTTAFGTTALEPSRTSLAAAGAAASTLLLRPEVGGLEVILVDPERAPVIVGRRAEPGARAGLESVSARHCRIERDAQGWTVTDLGSKNGTFVNGERVSEPARVRRGDVVQLGPAAVYRCE